MRGIICAVSSGMDRRSAPDVPAQTARRALIALVADIAWDQRSGVVPGKQRDTRNEAMSLLARIDRGDREAARRAMELVQATHDHAA